MAQIASLVGIVLVVSACASNPDAPVRSPARDYPHPPPRTADGQVLGAEGKDPSALLEESGTTDHPAPGWSLDEKGLKFNPRRPAGASDEAAVPEHEHEDRHKTGSDADQD